MERDLPRTRVVAWSFVHVFAQVRRPVIAMRTFCCSQSTWLFVVCGVVVGAASLASFSSHLLLALLEPALSAHTSTLPLHCATPAPSCTQLASQMLRRTLTPHLRTHRLLRHFTTSSTTHTPSRTMPAPQVHVASSKQEVGAQAAQEFNQIVNSTIGSVNSQTSAINVATSGGSLPETLAAGLQQHHLSEAAIKRLHFWYSDERCVKLDDKESNHLTNKPLYDALKLPLDSPQLHPINESLIDSPEKCASDYEQQYSQHVKNGCDIVLLGMGPDGHICSLFPDSLLNDIKDKQVTHITDSPKPPPKRITFTHPVLAKAKHIIFIVTGDGKAEAVQDVLENTEKSMKPAAIATRNAHGKVSFYLDSGAASKLSKQSSSSSKATDLSARQTDNASKAASTLDSSPAAY